MWEELREYFYEVITDHPNRDLYYNNLDAQGKQDLLDSLTIAKAEKDATAYKEKRKLEYPSIEEVVHAMLDGTLDDIQAARAIVKAKYPKP
jgi:hypothetical protein